jgi:hypothetical protein
VPWRLAHSLGKLSGSSAGRSLTSALS